MNKKQFERLEEECVCDWRLICYRLGLDFSKYQHVWLSCKRSSAYDFYKEYMEKDTTKLGKLLAGIDGQED